MSEQTVRVPKGLKHTPGHTAPPAVSASSVAVVVDSVDAGPANRAALQSASGIQPLPAGTINLDRVAVLTGDGNSGLSLGGNKATVIKSNATTGDWINQAAMVVTCGTNGTAALSWRGDETPANRPKKMPPNQVGWFFESGSEGWSYPRPNVRVLPGQLLPDLPGWEFMRAWHGVPFSASRGLTHTVPAGHGIAAGDKLWVTDGPSFNECVGEHVTAVDVTPTSVTLAKPFARTYLQPTFVRGPFPQRVTLRGMTFLGNYGTLIFMQATQARVVDCVVPTVPAIAGHDGEMVHMLGCSRMEISRCKLNGIKLSAGCGLTVSHSEIGSIRAEQGQIKTTINKCKVGWLDALHQCHDWTLKKTEFTDWFAVYDRWHVEDCTCDGLVRIRGKGCRILRLRAAGPVIIQFDYGAGPPDAANDVFIDDIDAAYIQILPGTSGTIRRCSAPIVFSDPATKANWVVDGHRLG